MSEIPSTAGAVTDNENDLISLARAALHLPEHVRLELQNVRDDGHGNRTVEYSVIQPVELRGREYGVADGVWVDSRASATLKLAQGRLVASELGPMDQQRLDLVKDQVKKLAATDQIDSPGSQAHGGRGSAGIKPWYVEVDAQGRKRLVRSHMA